MTTTGDGVQTCAVWQRREQRHEGMITVHTVPMIISRQTRARPGEGASLRSAAEVCALCRRSTKGRARILSRLVSASPINLSLSLSLSTLGGDNAKSLRDADVSPCPPEPEPLTNTTLGITIVLILCSRETVRLTTHPRYPPPALLRAQQMGLLPRGQSPSSQEGQEPSICAWVIVIVNVGTCMHYPALLVKSNTTAHGTSES